MAQAKHHKIEKKYVQSTIWNLVFESKFWGHIYLAKIRLASQLSLKQNKELNINNPIHA
jgi:hypothetical protein